MGIRTAFTARFASVAFQVQNYIQTIATVYNMYSDYVLTGAVDPWDVASLALDVLPVVGKGFKNILNTIRKNGSTVSHVFHDMDVAHWPARWRDIANKAQTLIDPVFIQQAEEQARNLGFTIRWADDAFLNAAARPGKIIRGQIDIANKIIRIRSNAPPYTVFHELQHAFHYVMDPSAFSSGMTKLAAEWYVFVKIYENAAIPKWYKDDAVKYMNDVLVQAGKNYTVADLLGRPLF
jgi:hypothetical protein